MSNRPMSDRGYLFDTGALIDIYHGRDRVQPFFERIFEDSFIAHISPISEAELWLGLRPDELERHEALLAFFVPLSLTSEAGRLAGEWMRRYDAQGLGWMGALIAATATTAGIPLLTRDQRLAAVLGEETEIVVYGLS
jgi:predicted nucleic acid-binding protein